MLKGLHEPVVVHEVLAREDLAPKGREDPEVQSRLEPQVVKRGSSYHRYRALIL